jgi:tRNA (guanosine-2'-O-)-methyltransferase
MKDLISFFESFITDNRKNVFDKILSQRTRYITVVLEDIFQQQNASAVIRTAECCGLMDVHIIENRNKFNVDREVSMGAQKWLNIYKYNKQENNTLEAINKLRKKKYRIIATSPHCNDTLLEDFDLSKGKAAFFMGTELTGLSKTVLDNVDEFVKIPMFGFTESYNISVSAALLMFNLVTRLQKSDLNWHLSTKEKEIIKLQWLRKSLKSANLLEKRFERKIL